MKDEKTIIFFDGDCMLCNSFIQFALKRKPRKPYYFAALQSKTAEQYLQSFSIDPAVNNTVYLLHQNKLYDRSTAVLKAFSLFKGLWPAVYIFIVIPRNFRDAIYNWVARNRYRWFGKQDHCELLPPELTTNRILN